jgi:hypothetical protein
MLQEDLQNALRQTDELKSRNWEEGFSVCKTKVAKCVVVGDSFLRNVGAEHADMMVECLPGIKTGQLHRVIVKRDLASPEIIIHVGANDLITTRNLDFVSGEVYPLVATANRKIPKCRHVLSGVMRRRDMSWRRIGALNDTFDCVANALGLNFVDTNSWIEDWDFAGDGLHLNGKGMRQLG